MPPLTRSLQKKGVTKNVTYLSNTVEDRTEMLEAIGIASFDNLLEPIPENLRLKTLLDLPPALDESGLLRHLNKMAGRNVNLEACISFLGAGVYDHFRPAVVAALQGRGEFATSYTPYQPEMSQGMLQAIYEYQTLICTLTWMDLANASMYDAATGVAEAALMAIHILDRHDVVVTEAMHPHYRQVLKTYLDATGFNMVTVPLSGFASDTSSEFESLSTYINDRTACVLFQQPDFFGRVIDQKEYVEAAHRVGALAISCVDPISLGLLKPPGELDVDIVVGEGQSLGNPMGFGGPLLGFFACKKKFVRHFPGRIVGATVDESGNRGYTMTLRTREQDIRREKATSNICTNQALLALAATIYLCELGKAGMTQVSDLSLQKAHYAYRELTALEGVEAVFPQSPFFKEFALKLSKPVVEVNRELLKAGILGGLNLDTYYENNVNLANTTLFCVTETRTREDIDLLVSTLKKVLGNASV